MTVRVVLVEPSHPGNIGSVARAMGNMGFTNLNLVRPVEHLVEEARVRSSGNEGILANATVSDTLTEAISDCSFIVGTSARLRTVGWPNLTPREAMHEVATALEKSQNAAILFGPERTGLSNRHIDRCDVLVRIPVDEKSPSINLASAVIILLYELHLVIRHQLQEQTAIDSHTGIEQIETMATHGQIEGFFEHLQVVLEEIEFIANGPREVLMRKIRRLFLHPNLTEDEVNILRGILTAVEKKSSAGSKPRLE